MSLRLQPVGLETLVAETLAGASTVGALFEVASVAETAPNMTYLGRLSRHDVLSQMGGSKAVVFPSEYYENFPLTIVEAFACGVPVVASNHGAMAEIVSDQQTGLLFDVGQSDDLAATIRWALGHRDALHRMGEAARQVYEREYTAEINFRMLMDIDHQAADTYYCQPAAARRLGPGLWSRRHGRRGG